MVIVDVRHFTPQRKRHGPLGRREEICRRPVSVITGLPAVKPMRVCLIPPCGIRVNCQFAQSVGAQTMCRQRGIGRDDSSLNETLTSQRATRARQPYSRMILGPVGKEEDARLLSTVQPYSRVCGQMTRGAGKGLGERHRTGWRMGPKRVAKTLEQAAPLPLEVNTTVSPIWAFSGARSSRIPPQPLVLLTVSHTVEPIQ